MDRSNLDHERALVDFVPHSEESRKLFLPDFIRLPKGSRGTVHSIALQLLIKIASPGVADFTKARSCGSPVGGPDNRRPVDFGLRKAMAGKFVEGTPCLSELVGHWQDGRIKMYVMQKGWSFAGIMHHCFEGRL